MCVVGGFIRRNHNFLMGAYGQIGRTAGLPTTEDRRRRQ
jgi:hypothetical protein